MKRCCVMRRKVPRPAAPCGLSARYGDLHDCPTQGGDRAGLLHFGAFLAMTQPCAKEFCPLFEQPPIRLSHGLDGVFPNKALTLCVSLR